MQLTMNWLTFLSLWCLALFCFVSNSLMALHHILIIVPCLYIILRKIKNTHLSKSAIFFGLMTLFIIHSVLINWPEMVRPMKNLTRTKYLVVGFLMIFAIRENAASFLTRNRISKLLHTFVISTSLASLIGIISMYTGYNFIRMKSVTTDRARGMYGMEITYGHGIALVCVLIATLLFFRKELRQFIQAKWLWGALLINFVGLYLSLTRGAMLGFIVGLTSLLWFKSKKLFIVATIGLVLLMSVAVWITKDEGSKNRYLIALDRSTNMRRVSQIITAFHIFKEKPFFGVGYRNFEPLSVAYKKKYDVKLFPKWQGHAHNNYLEILAGCGIFAFICMLLWHGFWLYDSFGAKTLYPKLFGPFLVAWIVSGMTQSSIIDGENMFLIMAVYAISQVLPKQIDSTT